MRRNLADRFVFSEDKTLKLKKLPNQAVNKLHCLQTELFMFISLYLSADTEKFSCKETMQKGKSCYLNLCHWLLISC